MNIYMAGRSGLLKREKRWLKLLRFRLLSYHYIIELEKPDETNPLFVMEKHNKEINKC